VVLADNARFTGRLLRREDARTLLRQLTIEFARVCRSAGKQPVLVVIPQPVDLRARLRGDGAAEQVFASLADVLPVVDLTAKFAAQPAPALYAEGALGPHTSAQANRMIAAELAAALRQATRGLLGTADDTMGTRAHA
jgi:hypothetical protein